MPLNVRETLIESYRAIGCDSFTAGKWAAEWIAALRRQRSGTVWYFRRADGRELAIRKD